MNQQAHGPMELLTIIQERSKMTDHKKPTPPKKKKKEPKKKK